MTADAAFRVDRRKWLQRAVLGAACPVWASAQTVSPPTPRQLLADYIETVRAPLFSEWMPNLPQCQLFYGVFKQSQLSAELDGMATLTAFIPVDSAWPKELDLSTLNEQTARQLVLRHVMDVRWNAVAQPIRSFTTRGGVSISVEVAQINNHAFELQGLRARNGFLHLFRGVL